MINQSVLIKKGTILIISSESESESLNFMIQLLSEQEYLVEFVIETETILEQLNNIQPDVILLSLDGLNQDSYELCQEIKTTPIISQIPVIFLIPLNQSFDRNKLFQVGGADYLLQPYQNQEILVKINTQIELLELQEKVQELSAEIEYLASLDILTQVANRRHFDKYLRQEWRRCARERIAFGDITQTSLSVIICDIDNLQNYNKIHGYKAGDNCLQTVAQVITSIVKRPADLVARFEEKAFAIILPNTKIEGAIKLSQQIQSEINTLKLFTEPSQKPISITLSFGVVSRIPTQALSPEVLVVAAMDILNEAKQQGGNCIMIEN